MKDGGLDSTVTGYWLIEIKSMFSVVVLRFDNKSREAYHSHAFNCISWLLKGKLVENFLTRYRESRILLPSLWPFVTKRKDFHKVDSEGVSWLLSIRGPWDKNWYEFLPTENRFRVLTEGRQERNTARQRKESGLADIENNPPPAL